MSVEEVLSQDQGAAAAGAASSKPGPEERRRIVVGVDGSQSSKHALAWAARLGPQTGAVVEAVIAWDLPPSYGLDSQVGVDYEGAAGRVVAGAINEVGNPAGVQPRVVQGHAAQVLIDASAGADLLVVGSRGHGGFVGGLLGSVSQHCVHHAWCPVVVMRGAQEVPSGARPQ